MLSGTWFLLVGIVNDIAGPVVKNDKKYYYFLLKIGIPTTTTFLKDSRIIVWKNIIDIQ